MNSFGDDELFHISFWPLFVFLFFFMENSNESPILQVQFSLHRKLGTLPVLKLSCILHLRSDAEDW